MEYPKKFFSVEQKKWCEEYERHTGFEVLMDDYLAGNESFVCAAHRSVNWYESHTSDIYLRVSRGIPGEMEEMMKAYNGEM